LLSTPRQRDTILLLGFLLKEENVSQDHLTYLGFVVSQLRQFLTLSTILGLGFDLLSYREAVLALALLDLRPARHILAAGYSRRRGGRPPKDPVAMFRCLVLMSLLGETSFNKWGLRLRREPFLAILSGFLPGESPAIGTFYLFADRLLDGAYQRRCPHVRKPSSKNKGSKGAFRRHLIREKEQAKLEREERRLRGQPDAPVKAAVANALARIEHPRADDLHHRIEDLLFRCAVVPSAQLGLLGDLASLTVAGDGSPVESHADGSGRALCTCRRDGLEKCECERGYADPDARWGYDSHREKYVFGFRLHALVSNAAGVELPLHLLLDGANAADVVMAVEAITRLSKLLGEYLPEAEILNAVFDAGYDSTEFERLLVHLGARPFIPLNPRNAPPIDPIGVKRDEHGVPCCVGGASMRFHGCDREKGVCVFNCPAKRPTRKNGKQVFTWRPEQCPLGTPCDPASVMGPMVRLPVKEDPRLNPPVPRSSEEWKEIYQKRTCAERLFSFDKEAGGLGERPYRRRHLVLLSGLTLALRKHAQAWVKNRFSQDELPRTAEELLALLESLAAQPAVEPTEA